MAARIHLTRSLSKWNTPKTQKCYSHSIIQECEKHAAEELQWARKPTSAQVLRPPEYTAIDEHKKKDTLLRGDLMNWAQLRNWDIPEGPACRIFSHTLTFPFTVAKYAHELNLIPKKLSSYSQNAEITMSDTLTVLCAGARAECTLPEVWWHEGLFALPNHIKKLHLNFIGPEVSSLRVKQLETPFKDVDGKTRVIKRSYFQGTLIDYLEASSSQRQVEEGENKQSHLYPPKMLWLSNPGLGHPALKDSWAPTLKYLLTPDTTCSNRLSGTRATPILVTSHSQKDQIRDIEALKQQWVLARGNRSGGATDEDQHLFHTDPHSSGFKSLRRVVDACTDKSKKEYVQANWGAFAFHSQRIIR